MYSLLPVLLPEPPIGQASWNTLDKEAWEVWFPRIQSGRNLQDIAGVF